MAARPVPGEFPSFPSPAHFKKGRTMAENLFSPGQRIMTKEGKDNFDRIFKKKKRKVAPLPVSDNLVDQEAMNRNGVTVWINQSEVGKYEDDGWRRMA